MNNKIRFSHLVFQHMHSLILLFIPSQRSWQSFCGTSSSYSLCHVWGIAFFLFNMSGLIYNVSSALNIYFSSPFSYFFTSFPPIFCPHFRFLILFDNWLFQSTAFLKTLLDLLLCINLKKTIYVHICVKPLVPSQLFEISW